MIFFFFFFLVSFYPCSVQAPDTDDSGSALYQSEVTGDKSGKTSSQRAGILRPREASSQADCHVPEVPGAGEASKHDADGVEFYE